MARSIIGAGFDEYVQKQISVRQNLNKIKSSTDDNVLKYQKANTAFLRLTSGVDVNNMNADAQNFQLFSTRFAGLGASGQFASGFNIGITQNSSYGSFSTNDYGYVPPPGLISADIKALNRGSLREATVNILAHSSTQFEIIEQLYLRLGYSMLLEWGHSSYFDNNGDYQPNNTYEVYSTFIKTNPISTILEKIKLARSGSDGNYDAMIGLVKNFDWSLEKDGSYNITLNIISTGDVIESLKQNVSHPTTITETTDVPTDQPPLQFNSEKTTLNKILYWLSSQIPPSKLSLTADSRFFLQGSETTADKIGAGIGLTPNQTQNSNSSAQGDVVGFIFPELNGVNDGTEFYNGQYFIKLGVLLRCIQNFCLLYNPTQGNKSIYSLNSNDEESFCFTYARHGSLDPRVCLIDVDQNLKLEIDPFTGTATVPTQSVNYNINNTYYDFKVITVYENTTVIYNKPWDPELGIPDSPLEIGSYGATTDSAGEAILNKFLQDNLGSLASIVQKSGPQTGGTVADLNNFSVNASSTNGIAILEKFAAQNVDSEDFYSDFFQQYGTYSPTVPTTVAENTNYITKVWDIIDSKFSPTVSYTSYYGRTPNTYNVQVKIENVRVTVSSLTKTTTGYTEANVGGTIDVANNLFNRIRDGSRFRVDSDNYPFIGRTMNIYINMNYAAKILQDYVDISSGAISMFDFLDKLMKGVQRALGNINNFSITYDEEKNEFSITDNTFIPFLNKYKPESFKNKPVEFITHTLTPTQGSFMRDASVKTQLSNNFKTMVTVGAQANGNVVGSNSTGLAIWNTGLTDRIIKEKTTVNNQSGTTDSDIDAKFYSNVGIVQNLYSAINDGNITDQQIDGATDAGVDLFNYEIGLYISSSIIPSVGFIPINLELTMDGLSGMRIYESYTADTKLLPPRYKDAIQYIITGVSHKIQNNDWTTTIQSISGPKYTGFGGTGKAPPIKSHSVTRKSAQNFRSTGPTESTNSLLGNNVQSNGTPSNKHEEIILKAMQASFSKGQTRGQCARGTGTMVINAIDIKNGGTGRELREGDSHGGSAKASAHHDWIASQGWTKYSFNGLTKAKVRDIVENGPLDPTDPLGKKRIPWIAGDVVCYWTTDGKANDFHSQYYTNGLYDSRYKWATDNDNNYKTAFVFKRSASDQWSLVILKAPIFN